MAAIFGIDAPTFARIRHAHGADEPAAADPYTLLAIAPDAPDEAVVKQYRRLVRENHPDRLIAEGLPAEAVALANRKLAALNSAWASIRVARGLR